MDLHRESIWISYCRVSAKGDGHQFGESVAHHRLACPEAAWERLKIGGGAPPIMCRHGWLLIYHGVHDLPELDQAGSIARRNRCLFLMARSSATARSTTSSSPRASIVVMILARPIASISTTAWPTIGLAWRVWMYPRPCRACSGRLFVSAKKRHTKCCNFSAAPEPMRAGHQHNIQSEIHDYV
jgi:hypothetical protein